MMSLNSSKGHALILDILGPVTGFVSLAGIVLGLVGLLVASAAVLRSSTVRTNLELLRGEVGDLTASNSRLSGENTQLKNEVGVLRDMVTSRPDIERLMTKLDDLQGAIRADYQGMLTMLVTRAGQQIDIRRVDE